MGEAHHHIATLVHLTVILSNCQTSAQQKNHKPFSHHCSTYPDSQGRMALVAHRAHRRSANAPSGMTIAKVIIAGQTPSAGAMIIVATYATTGVGYQRVKTT